MDPGHRPAGRSPGLFPYLFVWDTFGRKNGVASLAEMKRRIEKYRRAPVGPADPVGCIILGQPFFWDRPDWIPAPADFAKNIVQGKTYAADSVTARELWLQVEHRLRANAPLMVAELSEPAPMWSEPALLRRRLGQGTFRALITDNYQRRCAVTGEKALPVLDAAHIRPVGSGGQHRLDNGLLLRTDVHRLFDAGYVTVTPDGRFLVSRRLKDDFDNGEPYMPFHGQRIWMPGDPVDRPDQRVLEWHAGEVHRNALERCRLGLGHRLGGPGHWAGVPGGSCDPQDIEVMHRDLALNARRSVPGAW